MSTPLRLSGVIRESVVDGPGWRFVIFSQGCPHHCEGCQNPETHSYDGGYDSTVERVMTEVRKNKLLKGVTLSGGDPFVQAKNFSVLAKMAHEEGLDVITFTGYTIEQLMSGMNDENGWKALLDETDTLVDGKFILAQRSLELQFRGSKNQRVIDPKESMKMGKAVEKDF
ncbi:MAG: anaerobic ribonucleoside-triphosphate reductase activating protein [Oscillospiraceae bacterium]